MLVMIAFGAVACYLICGQAGFVGFVSGSAAACLAFFINTAFVSRLVRGEVSPRLIIPLVFLKIAAAGFIIYCSLAAGGSAPCIAIGISTSIAAPVLNILSSGKSVAGS